MHDICKLKVSAFQLASCVTNNSLSSMMFCPQQTEGIVIVYIHESTVMIPTYYCYFHENWHCDY